MTDATANAPPAKSRANAGQFVKGRSANPGGKKPGTKNRRTVLAEKMLANIDVPGILAKMERQAKKGDHAAAKLILDRTVPIRRGCPIAIKLPPIANASDCVAAMGVVIAKLASGTLSTIEAAELSNVIDAERKSIELLDVERRLATLEEKFK
ncbi:DUF5681 domain-containing protein [Bradyrhizobium erythrophlei]|uniref:DUF5681 domain-containing protein n=1 Tax=Bradyrhizobium erythrophlei TaxID=1437360 RepID=A0A1M7TEH4_9BRAD|nr:DUF5681 domain-containing protein [Bradyrhizobium erythrophlei]SHN69149.1 hypothetical protein SAMN05444170_1503 [Bradyrhizobium erythrophlei]